MSISRISFHRVFPLILLILAACNFPGVQSSLPTENSAATPMPTATVPSDAPLGAPENPIVMALVPSKAQEIPESAQALAAQLSTLTGLTIVPFVPASYTDLVEALGTGRVHVAVLPPFAYLLAHQKGYADVALEITQSGQDLSATEFLVNAQRVGENKFRVYFDEETGTNTANAATAMKQFADMKPCWTDDTSGVGYVVPLGLLNENNVETRPGLFLQGDATVVRSLYSDPSGYICEFGAARADSRSAVAPDHADVKNKVVIVWRTEPIVPFDGIAYAAKLPGEARIGITAAFMALLQTEAGRTALRDTYQIEELKLIDDTFYEALRHALEQSGLDLSALVH